MWGIRSWRVDCPHNRPLVREDRILYVQTNWINASAVSHPRWYFIRMTYERSHPDDLARNVWCFTRLQKDTQICCGTEMAINDGIRKIRPHCRLESRLHLSELRETSIRIPILSSNPKCYGQLHEPRIFYPSGHWPETVTKTYVSAHFR